MNEERRKCNECEANAQVYHCLECYYKNIANHIIDEFVKGKKAGMQACEELKEYITKLEKQLGK